MRYLFTVVLFFIFTFSIIARDNDSIKTCAVVLLNSGKIYLLNNNLFNVAPELSDQSFFKYGRNFRLDLVGKNNIRNYFLYALLGVSFDLSLIYFDDDKFLKVLTNKYNDYKWTSIRNQNLSIFTSYLNVGLEMNLTNYLAIQSSIKLPFLVSNLTTGNHYYNGIKGLDTAKVRIKSFDSWYSIYGFVTEMIPFDINFNIIYNITKNVGITFNSDLNLIPRYSSSDPSYGDVIIDNRNTYTFPDKYFASDVKRQGRTAFFNFNIGLVLNLAKSKD
jgi:hypothetical protein